MDRFSSINWCYTFGRWFWSFHYVGPVRFESQFCKLILCQVVRERNIWRVRGNKGLRSVQLPWGEEGQLFYLSAVIRRKTARTAIISQILSSKNGILTFISVILLDHIGVHHSYHITSSVPDHYCCLAHITLLRLRNKYLRTNLRRRYADLFHQVGKIISLSSPSLANTDGFITEFYMICYNTFSKISYF